MNRLAVDRALRAWRWKTFVEDVRAAWWVLGLVLVMFIGALYWFGAPRTVVGEAYGVAVGSFRPQTEWGRSPAEMSVRLEDGRLIAVTLPMHEPYRAGVVMEVAVLRRDWPPHTRSYRFVRYAEAR
jgi:hypothetical protein